MKKINNKSEPEADDELRPEYDFRSAVRGKHYKPLHDGYTVQIHQADGTTIVQHLKLEEGAVLLDPDVRQVFPDSVDVNDALRSLIALMAQMPDQRKSVAKKSRSTKTREQPSL